MNNFISKVTSQLEKFGTGSVKDTNPLVDEEIWVDTGIPELNFNLKTFGIKKGLIEISGQSTAGKTTLGLQIARNFMLKNKNAICIFMLSEERLNNDYVKRLGVPIERTFIVKSKMLEDLFYKTQIYINKIEKIWTSEKMSGKPAIILLWDSIGATNSRAELETFKENVTEYSKSVEKDTAFKMKHAKMADFAKSARTCVKAILAQLYEKNIIFITLNHLTANLDPMAKKKDTSTGGTWREFFCWLRIEMKVNKLKTSKLKIDGERWGQVSTIKIVKNDFGGYVDTDAKMCVGYGYTLNDNDIEFALQKGILKLENNKYIFMGNLIWNSPRSFFKLYRESNPLLKILHKKVYDARNNDLLNGVEPVKNKKQKIKDDEDEEDED